MKELEKIHASLSNNIISDVSSWAKKLPASNCALNSLQLILFQLKTFHPQRHGFHLLDAVEADRLVKEHTEVLQNERMFGLQGDGFADKARKAQEAPNVRIANKNRGMPGKITSRSHSLIWQQMDICSEFTKQAQFCNLFFKRV